MNPQQKVTPADELTADQMELLPALVEGAEPDAYIVIPVALLSRQVTLSAQEISKRHRGEIRAGEFTLHLMRSLKSVGALVNTKYLRDEPLP